MVVCEGCNAVSLKNNRFVRAPALPPQVRGLLYWWIEGRVRRSRDARDVRTVQRMVRRRRSTRPVRVELLECALSATSAQLVLLLVMVLPVRMYRGVLAFDRRYGNETGPVVPPSGAAVSTDEFDSAAQTVKRVTGQTSAPGATASGTSAEAQQEKTLRNMMGGYR